MEKIDINSVVTNPYSSWSEFDELDRNKLLARFPHSIPVATSYNEMESANEWLVKAVGAKGNNWEVFFYYKQAYNFGYAEYFFHKKDFLIIFENEIPKVYGVFFEGKKLKTNCEGDYIDVD